jgi:hypothetical protein
VSYFRKGGSVVNTMSKTRGNRGGIELVGGWGVRYADQARVLVGLITLKFPPSRVQLRVPGHVLGVEVAGHQNRQYPTPRVC